MMFMTIHKIIIQQRKVLIVFDDVLADMEANKKLSPIRGRKLNISLCLFHNLISKYLKL